MKKIIIIALVVLVSCSKQQDKFLGTWVHKSEESEIYNDTLHIKKLAENQFTLDLKITYKSDSKFSKTKVKKENFSANYNKENNSMILNNNKSLIMQNNGNLIIGSTEFSKVSR